MLKNWQEKALRRLLNAPGEALQVRMSFKLDPERDPLTLLDDLQIELVRKLEAVRAQVRAILEAKTEKDWKDGKKEKAAKGS